MEPTGRMDRTATGTKDLEGTMTVTMRAHGEWGSWRLVGVAAAIAAAGMALATAGAAGAQPPDPCSPVAVMRAHAAAMNQMADYLDANPDVEQVFDDAGKLGTPEERHDAIRVYTDAHPDVATALQAIDQPLDDLGARCQTMPGGVTPGQ